MHYILYSLVVALTFVHSTNGMLLSWPKQDYQFASDFNNPWDPLANQKEFYQQAVEYYYRGEIKAFEECLLKAAEPVEFSEWDSLLSRKRSTGYYPAEYELARLKHERIKQLKGNDKQDAINQTLDLYFRALKHSRFSFDSNAKEFNTLSFERIQELSQEAPHDVLIIKAIRYLQDDATFQEGLCLLRDIENKRQDYKISSNLLARYGWNSVFAFLYMSEESANGKVCRNPIPEFNDPKNPHYPVINLHVGSLFEEGAVIPRNVLTALNCYVKLIGTEYESQAMDGMLRIFDTESISLNVIGYCMQKSAEKGKIDFAVKVGGTILDPIQESHVKLRHNEYEDSPRFLSYVEENLQEFVTFEQLLESKHADSYNAMAFVARYYQAKGNEAMLMSNNFVTEAVMGFFEKSESYLRQAYNVAPKKSKAKTKSALADLYAFMGHLYKQGVAPFVLQASEKGVKELLDKMVEYYKKSADLGSSQGIVEYGLVTIERSEKINRKILDLQLKKVEEHVDKVSNPASYYARLFELYSGKKTLKSGSSVDNRNKAEQYGKKAVDTGRLDLFTFGEWLYNSSKNKQKQQQALEYIQQAVNGKDEVAEKWMELHTLKEEFSAQIQQKHVTQDDCKKVTAALLRFIQNKSDFDYPSLNKLAQEIGRLLAGQNQQLSNMVNMALAKSMQKR